jgi:membrane-associated protease RseP (regulator of RpoE activity)
MTPIKSPRLPMPLGWLIAVAALSAGCATHHRPMTNATGWSPGCQHSGLGWIGAQAAESGHMVCTQALEAAGFLDVASLGSTGLSDLTVERGALYVGQVAQDSPAQKAGVLPGDRLVSIDGQLVRDALLARKLLFGRAGSAVSVWTRRGDALREVTLVRAVHVNG